MRLLVVRHGPAGDKQAWKKKGRPDAERPLTEDGRRKTAKAAKGLSGLVPSVDVLAASPLVRAAQTADALAKRWKKARRQEWPELAPGGDAAARLRPLLDKPGVVAVVGHEPDLSGLIGELLGAPIKLQLKKAGAALLEVTRGENGSLLWLLEPGQLRELR